MKTLAEILGTMPISSGRELTTLGLPLSNAFVTQPRPATAKPATQPVGVLCAISWSQLEIQAVDRGRSSEPTRRTTGSSGDGSEPDQDTDAPVD